MNFCIVVARFNEDLEWTKQFSNVVIYNKGDKLTDDFNEILLNNVGREGHTYYKHIYDNYDNLTNYTIFLQGNPFDHSPNIISNLNKYITNDKLNINFEFLSEKVHNCKLSGCPIHPGLPLRETYKTLFNNPRKYGEFKFGNGAQFIVSKKTILKNPLLFTLKLLKYYKTK